MADDGDDEEEESDTATAYTSVPVHYSLPHAHWLLTQGRLPAHRSEPSHCCRRC